MVTDIPVVALRELLEVAAELEILRRLLPLEPVG